jgi:hypothetical protein
MFEAIISCAVVDVRGASKRGIIKEKCRGVSGD